jgi:hypothetical protein
MSGKAGVALYFPTKVLCKVYFQIILL